MTKSNFEKINRSKVINASEIGQFTYCSISWHLQKIGYNPDSKLLKYGTEKHINLGNTIDKTEKNQKISNFLNLIGLSILIVIIFLFIFEVIL